MTLCHFTRVPTSLAVQVAKQRLELDTHLAERSSLTVTEIITLLKLCLDATYLAFRGSFYRQIHGTAMGSPVSVTVANLVMEDVEQRALATFTNPPKVWKRYVDDTCCALATSDIDRFHQHINSIEPHIQFTVEIETNGQLPFLDLLLRREEDGSISTSVYRKPTNTDRYLDFSSHHPQAHKAAVVRTLMNRAKVLPSSVLAHTDEEVQVTAALQSSGYPLRFIQKSSTPTARVPIADATHTSSITLPYIKGVSEAIRRILAPLCVRTSFRPAHTLRKVLVHVKDSIPPEQRSGVVYRIPCSECPKEYIGQTGRSLMQWIKEHRRALTTGNCVTSAAAEHALTTNHAINWDHATVIDHHPNTSQRCLLESWHIVSQPESLNREVGPLPDVYHALLPHPRGQRTDN